MFNINDFPQNPFVWGVSINAYPHSIAIQVRHALLEQNFKGMIDFFRIHKASVDWTSHFKLAVRHVAQRGGIAHLYLHSWEIDELKEWGHLEGLFGYLSSQADLRRVTNGDLLRLWYQTRQHG
jgi:peptidoglycan-N-acetylglucosamine deacetylase